MQPAFPASSARGSRPAWHVEFSPIDARRVWMRSSMKRRGRESSHGEPARTRRPGPPLIQEGPSCWDIAAIGRFWDGALDRFNAYVKAAPPQERLSEKIDGRHR